MYVLFIPSMLAFVFIAVTQVASEMLGAAVSNFQIESKAPALFAPRAGVFPRGRRSRQSKAVNPKGIQQCKRASNFSAATKT